MQFPKVQISKQWDPFRIPVQIMSHDCPEGQYDPGSGSCISCPLDFEYNTQEGICVHKEICPTDFHWAGSHYQVDLDTTVGGGCILNNS